MEVQTNATIGHTIDVSTITSDKLFWLGAPELLIEEFWKDFHFNSASTSEFTDWLMTECEASLDRILLWSKWFMCRLFGKDVSEYLIALPASDIKTIRNFLRNRAKQAEQDALVSDKATKHMLFLAQQIMARAWTAPVDPKTGKKNWAVKKDTAIHSAIEILLAQGWMRKHKVFGGVRYYFTDKYIAAAEAANKRRA